MEEKRKYVRIQAPIVITYTIIKEPPVTQKTVTKDFSEGGIHFCVYEKLKVGATLEMHIETPFDTMPVSATGEVVWTKALSDTEGREVYDIGVKFTEMQPFDKKRLSEATAHFLSMGKKYRAA